MSNLWTAIIQWSGSKWNKALDPPCSGIAPVWIISTRKWRRMQSFETKRLSNTSSTSRLRGKATCTNRRAIVPRGKLRPPCASTSSESRREASLLPASCTAPSRIRTPSSGIQCKLCSIKVAPWEAESALTGSETRCNSQAEVGVAGIVLVQREASAVRGKTQISPSRSRSIRIRAASTTL